MAPVVSAWLAFFGSLFQSRQAMHLEILTLQHQVAVYQQSVHRLQLRSSDRLFWSWLSLGWSGWQDALPFVRRGTMIAWQKRRFRDHWRRLSHQRKPGRPVIAKEIRALISAHVTSGSGVGRTTDRRRAAEARHQRSQIDGREVPSAAEEAIITQVEDIPQHPCQGAGRRFLGGADRGL
jgi:hypothetical protein